MTLYTARLWRISNCTLVIKESPGKYGSVDTHLIDESAIYAGEFSLKLWDVRIKL